MDVEWPTEGTIPRKDESVVSRYFAQRISFPFVPQDGGFISPCQSEAPVTYPCSFISGAFLSLWCNYTELEFFHLIIFAI